MAQFYKDKKKHIITTQIDHKCVLDSCRRLEDMGFDVTYLPVEYSTGLVDMEALKNALRPDTLLVSVIYINNEIGVMQPLKEIGELCKANKTFFHTDAAQGFGKVPIDVNEMNIDLLSISGHKIYGPKGIGALYIRRKPRVRLLPLINGGGQEKGLRSGTLSPSLCVGLGHAAKVALEDMESDAKYIRMLNERFYKGLTSNLDHLTLNGHETERYDGNLNISFAGVEGESLIMAIKDCAVSSGSACTSASLEPSYVLRAIGVEDDLAHTSLRIGFGRFTSVEEVDYAVDLLSEQVTKLREMSPLWEMMQDGIDIKQIEWTQH